MTDYAGIDYGLGQSNIDKANGIRFGVISIHSIMPERMDRFENEYGDPRCPECGNSVIDLSDMEACKSLPDDELDWDNYEKHGCNDYACLLCELFLDSGVCCPEEPLGWSYEKEGYVLTDCLDNDVFVLKSPYYTFAQFCSPCVPGAGNLDTPCESGPKTYCLGADWFEGGKAPYPVYRVSDNQQEIPQNGKEEK